MKVKMRGLLLLALALFLLMSTVPLTVSADVTYSGNCGADGDNVTWEIDVNTGTLCINGTGDMADYDEPSDAPWEIYENYPGFSCVVVGEGVTSVGDNALRDTSVTKIMLSSTVKKFGRNSFSTSYDIVIAENNPYIKIDDSGVFYSADGKTLIYALKNLSTSYASDMFDSYTVPDGVEEIAPYAFDNQWMNSSFVLNLPSSIKNIPITAFRVTWRENHFKPRFSVDKNNPYYSSDEYGVLFDKDKEVLYMAPSNEDVNEMGYNIFGYVIPETVKEISAYAFDACDPQSVLITENVTKIGSCAFRPLNIGGTYILYVPRTVTSLADDFMGDFSDSTGFFVYYEGTLSEWNTLYSGTNYFFTIKFEHKHNISVYETCTKRLHKCTVCHTAIASENIDNHDWDTYDNISSCTGGTVNYFCAKDCGASKSEYVEAGHQYQFVSNGDATCTEDGTMRKVCSRCNNIGETVVDEGSKLGHDKTASTVLSERTCTQDGISVQVCKRCSEVTASIESAYSHYDNDGDGKCDECKVMLESDSDTDVASSNFISKILEFFRKIADFFKQLFNLA